MVFTPVAEELGLIPVVSEFPDVFPEELPRMPPDRELEFAIDLVAGTATLYKKYYRMPSFELVELKKQLDDMLEKGYILPSSSPWDHLQYLWTRKMVVSECAWTIVS